MIVNFDVWGIMPPAGQESCDFKICELTGKRGMSPKENGNLIMKKASLPSPFLVCLYFSVGLGGYMVSRFNINRRSTPAANDREYTRQVIGIVTERIPPQICRNLANVEVDSEGQQYFPPRRGTRGQSYREVGFWNINWQAKRLHAYDRAPLCRRLSPCGKSREPVRFNDGLIDMFRWRVTSFVKNTPTFTTFQCDKKKDMTLKFSGGRGKGIFFQWDGEARFAFRPDGSPFNIFIRQVFTIPVVIGPDKSQEKFRGSLQSPDKPVWFEFCGDTEEERDAVKRRMLKSVGGKLTDELHATEEELRLSGFEAAST